jgi:hypothetical protein
MIQMARNLTAGMLTELTAEAVRPIHFVEAVFSGGTFRFWTGVGDITWDGELWTGAGNLLSITSMAETTLVRANGLVIRLNGINSSLLAAVLAQTQQSKTVKCWLGFLDSAGNVIADPYNFFTGFMDLPEIQEGPETSTVTIGAESELIELMRPRMRRYTNEDQINEYSADKGFAFVNFIQNWNGTWGGGYETADKVKFDVQYTRRPHIYQGGEAESSGFGESGFGDSGESGESADSGSSGDSIGDSI